MKDYERFSLNITNKSCSEGLKDCKFTKKKKKRSKTCYEKLIEPHSLNIDTGTSVLIYPQNFQYQNLLLDILKYEADFPG